MASTILKANNRKESGSFMLIPHVLIKSENYASLSPRAVKLLIDVYGQYRGTNNGDLCMAFSVMQKVGWTSKDQLQKARDELIAKGWIVLTRQGGRKKPSLYGVTFKPINDCNGKLDHKYPVTPLHHWKQWHPPKN